MINIFKNNFLSNFRLVFLLIFTSCSGQKEKPLPPKRVKENQYIYHYKRQTDIDTTSFYSFKLLSKDSIKKKKVKKWTKDKIKKFEETLENFQVNSNKEEWDLKRIRRRLNLRHRLSDYVRQVTPNRALEILTLFAKKVKGLDILISSVPNLGALDYLIIHGNEITKRKAQDILIGKLKASPFLGFDSYSFYLYDNKTPKYFKVLENLVAKNQKKNISEKVLFEYVRVGGVKTLPNLLKWSKKYHNKIKTAIRILYKYHNIDKNTSAKINSVLKSNHIFYGKNEKDRHLYISDIGILVKKFKEQGIKINLTNQERYNIVGAFYKNDYSLDITEVLFNFNLLFVYKADNTGFGHFNHSAGNYEKVMEYYMNACKNDLPTFSIQTHLKRDENFVQNYALLLGNEKEAFVVKTTDKKDRDYDDILMKELFNYVLEVKATKKKFELLKPSNRSYSQYVFYQKPIIDNILKELNQKITLDDWGYRYFYKNN